MDKAKLKSLICICIASLLLTACAPKAPRVSKEEIVKKQYKALLKNLWIALNPTDETFLQIAIEAESKGGATIEDLRYQQKDVDALIGKKLLRWDNEKTRYFITDLGRDVYNTGQELKQEEAKKPEYQRNHRLLRDKQVAVPKK